MDWIKDRREEADLLEFMADCIVRLDQRVEAQVTVRRLRVTKYRGSGFLSNEHPFTLTGTGPNMLPVSSVTLSYGALDKRVSSGNPVLDTLGRIGDQSGTGFIDGIQATRGFFHTFIEGKMSEEPLHPVTGKNFALPYIFHRSHDHERGGIRTAGCSCFLRKPIDQEALLKILLSDLKL